MNRRNAFLAGVGAIALASCSQATDVSGTVKQIADVVQQVQAGVTSACATAGKVVPTATTVLAVLEGLVGSQITTGNIGQAVSVAQQAIDVISKACPPQGATALMSAPAQATVNGKDVELKFY